jgi:hypothetical protein
MKMSRMNKKTNQRKNKKTTKNIKEVSFVLFGLYLFIFFSLCLSLCSGASKAVRRRCDHVLRLSRRPDLRRRGNRRQSSCCCCLMVCFIVFVVGGRRNELLHGSLLLSSLECEGALFFFFFHFFFFSFIFILSLFLFSLLLGFVSGRAARHEDVPRRERLRPGKKTKDEEQSEKENKNIKLLTFHKIRFLKCLPAESCKNILFFVCFDLILFCNQKGYVISVAYLIK